ncbi:MAG: penicillin-binding protein 2 [Balneolaceae bacterium]|nr:penicillin-binding protein 2 [Balneolaceae bacterium]MDR9446689.1 penicillin-binding protein 2 [Balneolaceae bacterium]
MKTHDHAQVQLLRRILLGIVVVLWGALFFRLIQIQVFEHERYQPLSQKNALRLETVAGTRGTIYDKNGEILVENQPVFTVTITPIDYDTSNNQQIASILNIEIDEYMRRIERARRYSRHRPSVLAAEIPFGPYSLLEENRWRLPGIGFRQQDKRNYPSSARASHVFGYLREADLDETQASESIRLGDKIGKSGLELVYDPMLRGGLGERYYRVNALGQSLGEFTLATNERRNPPRGDDLVLTLDEEVQAYAERLMGNSKGAAVVMDPSNGALLALVSSPDVDLTRLAGRLDREYWADINTDSLTPLFNRVTSASQPPGSTLKPYMGMIGLHMGLITPETVVQNTGTYRLGRDYTDLAPPGDYILETSLAFSSNTYFFELMEQMARQGKLDEWAGYLRDLGLGQRTGIDLGSERPGIVPDSSKMDQLFGSKQWGLGDLINLGIGQGVFSVTPIQLAVSTSLLANGGQRVTPHIVSEQIEGGVSRNVLEHPTTPVEWIEEDALEPIHKGMRAAVQNSVVSWLLEVPELEIAGKTGTAQNPRGQDHGWFTGFAPLNDPKVVVVVFKENGGFGSVSAAPIGSLLIEKVLTGTTNRGYVEQHVDDYVPPAPDEDEDEETDRDIEVPQNVEDP